MKGRTLSDATAIVLLDFARAFDSVGHAHLFAALNRLGTCDAYIDISVPLFERKHSPPVWGRGPGYMVVDPITKWQLGEEVIPQVPADGVMKYLGVSFAFQRSGSTVG
ncbi:hypothetical protein CDAR_287321 [Caerostris darwini]|uniref:Reverse transcriptase domain-containing protein n=1 Tax=Caerostris darwini TaxID=1538125 RepID=A0AAV4SHI4_9ARAC|nr:hypothetical protein CDAR_287321 [Caerostris darwini]